MAENDQIVEDLYLTALGREPTAEEKAKLVATLGEAKDKERREAVEDLYWSVLSSKAFLFNH